MCRTLVASIALCLLWGLQTSVAQMSDEEFDLSWYNTEELPEVDLEGLVANLTAEITWFKYVGRRTMACAELARRQDTLMLAVERLHDCLESAYQECASEFADQTGCNGQPARHFKPCGHMRLGYQGNMPAYDPNLQCRWYLRVPSDGGIFVMNLTIDELYLESSGLDCTYDYVMIYDGYSPNSRSWGRYCGRIPRFTLYGSTNQMMLTAVTDASIGKHGFRAVYQVMDVGYGHNYETPSIFKESRGTFSLATSATTIFERYWESFYYTKWYIRAGFGQVIDIDVEFIADTNATGFVFNGPSFESEVLLKLDHTDLGMDGLPINLVGVIQRNSTTTTSFNAMAMVQRKSLNDTTSFNAQWFMRDLNSYSLDHTGDCMGDSNINLTTGTTYTIGVSRNATLDAGQPIQCFWHLKTDPGEFIQLDVRKFQLNASDYDRCMYEGLLIMNGPTLDSGIQRIGPLCYDEPLGIFTSKGTKQVTSSGQEVLVMFYSFLRYPSMTAGDTKRGSFEALVSKTPCQGLLQVCDPLPPNSIFQTPNYRAEVTRTNVSVDVTFFCDKAKCCRLQQFPTYTSTDSTYCSVSVKTEGAKLLATSEFRTELVVPDKWNQQLEYSCQRKERLRVQEVDKYGGAHSYRCLGTEVYLNYTSTSIWSMQAFTVQVKENKCGYYRPDRHVDNEFYPPCAVAQFPVKEGKYPVKYVDPNYKEGRYFNFMVRYRNTDYSGRPSMCSKDCSNFDILQVLSTSDAFAWSSLPELPFRWRTWGAGQQGNWTRDLIIRREEKYDTVCNSVPGCEIHIEFFSSTLNKGPVPGVGNITCPEGHSHIGRGCYMIPWPGNSYDDVLNDTSAISWEEGQQLCQRHGSDLIALNSDDEFEPIKIQMQFDWWQKFLHKVPGVKVLHIGLRWSTTTKDERWIHNEPLTYSNWAVPDYKRKRPDKTTYPGKEDELIESIRSPSLQNSLIFLQPWNIADYHCTVMVLTSFHEPSQWARVPCNEKIPGSLPLCESQVSPATKESKTLEVTPAEYQTLVVSQPSGNTLQLADYDCPPPFSLVGKKCLYLHYEGKKVTKEAASRNCRNIQYGDSARETIAGRAAMFDDELLLLVNETLPFWKQDLTTGHIRIHYNGSQAVEGQESGCYALVATPAYQGGSQTSFKPTWVFTPLRHCGESVPNEETVLPPMDQLKSYICEIDPIVVNETCGGNHFECPDGTCVLLNHKCDGIDDCYDGSDEKACNHVCEWHEHATSGNCFTSCFANNCTCHQFYFQCESGGCIPGSKICDYQWDCLDGSDEEICNHPSCTELQFECADKTCISMDKKCDFRRDCLDGSDERPDMCRFDLGCPSSHRRYFTCGDGKCIPMEQRHDLIPDCHEDMMKDEDGEHSNSYLEIYREAKIDPKDGSLLLLRRKCTGYMLNCDVYYDQKCYEMHQACVYDHDQFGNMAYCRTGTHLQHCEAKSCGSMFKCPNSYCVPTRKLCDGASDCPHGEDEKQCNRFQCPGMFRCKGQTNCIQQSQVCDGVVDCKDSRDDEALCAYAKVGCPDDCVCFGTAVSCAGRGLEDIPGIQESFSSMTKGVILLDTRILIFSHNQLTMHLPPRMKRLSNLYRLDLSNNGLSSPGGENMYQAMAMLVELYLHNNKITSLARGHFVGLVNLRVLTLHGNAIGHLMLEAFMGLGSLPLLNLSHQEIRTLDDFQFSGLSNLKSLNLSYNKIDAVTNKSFVLSEDGGRLEQLVYLNLKGNPLSTAESFAFLYLPEKMFLESDEFKYCCFAQQVERCVPGPDEFSSCERLVANRRLRVAMWTIGLLAFLGNLVILQQRMKHEKDTGTSLLVQHLSFSDFLMGVYVLIIVGSDLYHKGTYIYEADTWRKHPLCKLGGFLSTLSCEMSSYCIMLITMDRLYGCFPGCGKGKGMGVRGARGFIALGWTTCCVLSVVPILEFSYFGSSEYVRGGVCTTFNVLEGTKMSGWEFSMALFVIVNFALYAASAIGYGCVYRGMMKGIDAWEMSEEMTEEEKEAERQFRRNEFILGRRLVLLVATNFLVWMPLIVVGAMALLGEHVDQMTSAWIAMFVLPLNAALNPFMYSFTTKPYRIPSDDLLANWRGEETEELDQDDEDQGETDAGESTTAGTSGATAKELRAAAAREAVLREML